MDILDRIRKVPRSNVAIVHGDRKISYSDLLDAAASLAEIFVARNHGPGRAICVEEKRSISCVVSWLAAWIANAPFIAIDPELPEARKEKYRAYGYDVAVRKHPKRELDMRVDYVFLSSGSTGEAKAILMPASGVDTVIRSQIKTFRIDENSRVLWMLSPGFDASLSDVFTALCAGATLVIMDAFSDVETFSKFLEEEDITHMDIPPSLLSRLTKAALPKSLRTIIVGGEVCSPSVVREFAKSHRLVNCYGPTETTICSSMKVLTADADPRNIGVPNKDFIYRICGDELWIHSPGMAISYGANIQPERFVNMEGRRWFRTGDRVDEVNGEYFFLGRVDRQFKMNGQLVNPEEIEKHLAGNEKVLDCRVEKIDGKIIAYCVSKDNNDASVFLEKLEHDLPAWMIPRIIFVDEISRNERGKVIPTLSDAIINPIPDDCVFQSTMSKILGYPVNEHDNFWKVGGDSLLAFDFIEALAELGQLMQVETLREFGSPFRLRQVNALEVITRDRILKAAETFSERSFPSLSGPIKTIFLTGATGFLGRRVLSHLVDDGYQVICLVRADNDEQAKFRLSEFKDIEVYAGDLTQPNFGFSKNLFQELSQRCDTFIHLAADLNLSKSYNPESAIGILNEIGNFFEKGINKKMIFASTLSVFASTDFRGRAEEVNLDFEGVNHVYGGYTAEKILTEHVVRNRFLGATILRFGLLTGDSQSGAFHDKNVLVSFIRTLAKLEISVRSDAWRFDITPIDYAALATARLLSQSGTFHIANVNPPNLNTLIESVEDEASKKIESVSPTVFLKALQGLDGIDAQLSRLATARLNRKNIYDILRGGDLFLATDIDFCASKTEAWLATMGCKRLESNEELLGRYVRWALSIEEE